MKQSSFLQKEELDKFVPLISDYIELPIIDWVENSVIRKLRSVIIKTLIIFWCYDQNREMDA